MIVDRGEAGSDATGKKWDQGSGPGCLCLFRSSGTRRGTAGPGPKLKFSRRFDRNHTFTRRLDESGACIKRSLTEERNVTHDLLRCNSVVNAVMSPRRQRLVSAFLRLRYRSLRQMLDHNAVIERDRLLDLQRLGSLELAREYLVGPSSPEAVSVSPLHSTPCVSHLSLRERAGTIASPGRTGDSADSRIARLCSLAYPLEEEREETWVSALPSTPTSSLHPVSRATSVAFHAVHAAEVVEIPVEGTPQKSSRLGPFGLLAAICSRLNPRTTRQGAERRARRHVALVTSRPNSPESQSSAPFNVIHAQEGLGVDQAIETNEIEPVEMTSGGLGAGALRNVAAQFRRAGRKQLRKGGHPAKDQWQIHAIRA